MRAADRLVVVKLGKRYISEEKESAEMEQSWREGGVRAAESQVPPERKLGGVQEHRAWQ